MGRLLCEGIAELGVALFGVKVWGSQGVEGSQSREIVVRGSCDTG